MADPIRAALERLVSAYNQCKGQYEELWPEFLDAPFAVARAALEAAPADGPAVPEGREPAAVAAEASPATPPAGQPVAVSERLPEPGVKVLAHYFNDLGKGRTICAIWVPAKSRSDDFDSSNDDFTEYDEETDKFYWPEGWYETIENWEDLGYVKVYEGDVIYWQPLPQWPARALPIPQEEVE